MQCELHHAGCKVSLPRCDLTKHMEKESHAHISLLNKQMLEKCAQITVLEGTTAKQAQELTQLREDYKQLTMIDNSQSQEIGQLVLDLSEVKAKISAQSQDLCQAQETMDRQSNELGQLTQELRQFKEEITSQMQDLIEMISSLKQSQQTAIRQLQVQLQHDLKALKIEINEMQRNDVPVTMTMKKFNELKREDIEWHSDPFYTAIGGYKMCLSVYANGYGMGKGTHVSVYTCLMCTDTEFRLAWPFRGNIMIQIVNQLEDKQHHSDVIRYTDQTPDVHAAQVTASEHSVGWGIVKFVPHSRLGFDWGKNCQYLKNQCLVFHIMSC